MSDISTGKFDVKQFIKDNEARGGPRLDAYFDTEDILTIGYGHKITKDSPADIRNLKKGDKISAKRAESLFEADFKYHANEISKMPGFDKAPPLARAAAIDLAFNMGPNFYKDRKGKKGFTEFAKAFKEGDYEKAALELKRGSRPGTISLYYRQTGDRPEKVMALLEGQEREIKLTDKIESFVRGLKKAKGTVEDLASALRVDIETASKLFKMPELKADKPEITLTDLMAKSQPSVNLPDVSVDQPEITLADLMAESKPSVKTPDVNIDKPDVSLEQLMAQSKPSLNVPSAGSATAYNPYAQSIDLGEQTPATKENLVAKVSAPIVQQPVTLQEDSPLDRFINKRAEIVDSPTEVVEPQEISSDLDSFINRRVASAEKTTRGMGRALAQGVTFGFSDELEAALSEGKYSETIKEIRAEQKEFAERNPGTALSLEVLGAIPTSVVSAAGLGRLGLKTVTSQAAVEGTVYGIGSGESFEDRVQGAVVGGIAGATLGRVIDYATKPKAAGGLKTEADNAADAKLDRKTDEQIEIEAEEAAWTERNIPDYDRIPLRDATTVGEFYNSAVTGLKKFYDDKITGASDAIARYMPEVGMRFQRADETSLRIVNKEMEEMAEELLPIAKVINEDKRVKGIFLDFAAGRITNNIKDVGGYKMRLADDLDESMSVLFDMLREDFSAEQLKSLKKYLQYSHNKNIDLNTSTFGIRPEMFPSQVYMHTRNRFVANKLKEEGASDLEIEKRMFNDSGMGYRSRATYTRDGKDMPSKPGEERLNPDDYDNPLITDMQRLFQLEKLHQIQRIFGVDISQEIGLKKNRLLMERAQKGIPGEIKDPYLTPSEFMDALEMSLYDKGISKEGAEYAVNKMTETIMGAQKAPHPLIQALSSFSYATTLAGPMSAFLNIADIPLLGAKYGREAALEGLNELNPFKKVPSIDLKKAGLDNQVMGEFTNKLNDQMQEGAEGFIQKIAKGSRKGADLLMKGSGFAAMDRVGKRGVIRGVLKSAVDDANAGNLADNWGFYFSKEELDLIAEQFRRHGTDHTKYTGQGAELAEELMFAGLGQQQLISGAGRPAAWARNPNLRPLWALRGFVVKQQALALREVVGNIKAGKPEEAAKFLGRYALYGAGGYAVLNETRQGIFGDGDFSAAGLVRGYGDAWASLLTANTLGLNDYQFGQIKQNGLIPTIIEGMVPIAIDRPLDIGGRVVDFIDDKRYATEVVADTFPIVKQSARGVRNIGGLFDLEEVVEPAEAILERKPKD